jgi:hypothetical protein
MLKSKMCAVASTLLLTACATAPNAPPTVCPQIPLLEVDAPARDWQGEMQNFLQGIVTMPPDYNLPTKPALGLTMPREMR